MSDFLSHFESVHASFVIEDVEDFAQYGLDDPSCTVTLTSADGSTVFQMGDYSTMDEKRYVTLGTARSTSLTTTWNSMWPPTGMT